MATAETQSHALLTAEEFGQRPDPGHPEELVKGRIVAMPLPEPGHGYVCGNASFYLNAFIKEHDLGRVISNDAGVITERGPDTVRGPDVCFYSYDRMPRGPIPKGYGAAVPELAIEVRSPSDRWPRLLVKVAEYLEAGVLLVCVLDPKTRTARLYDPEGPEQVLNEDEELTFPGVLEGFRVPVRRFFD